MLSVVLPDAAVLVPRIRSNGSATLPMRHTMTVLPWLLPGLILSTLIGIAASRRIAQALRVDRAVAWALVVGFGLVLSATLTPLDGGFEFGVSGIGTCDMSRIGLAPFQELVHIGDTSLNVLLLIPLGLALGLMPGSRRRTVLVAVAIALPFVIEVTQMLLPVLGRGCQSADVSDNLTGLLVGFLIGTGVDLARRRVRDSSRHRL
jgi:glycopeptide antibiotics resistance protein